MKNQVKTSKSTIDLNKIADRTYSVICYTLLITFLVITLLPLINVLATSLSSYKDSNVLFFPKMFDLFSIKDVLSDSKFIRAFGITLVVVVSGTAISVLSMVMLGYALSKESLPFRKAIFMFFLVAMLFSGGMIPNYLLMVSIKFTDTLFALVLPSAVMVFHMILAKNFFEGLPPTIEESAKIDGASNLIILFKIVLPISLSMITTISLFTAVVYWNNYFSTLMYISTQAKELYPLSYYILQISEQFKDPNASATMGNRYYYQDNIQAATIIMSILPIACTYPFFLKYFVKGVTVGSVKG